VVEKLREKGKNAKVVFCNGAANSDSRRNVARKNSSEYAIFTSLWEETKWVYENEEFHVNQDSILHYETDLDKFITYTVGQDEPDPKLIPQHPLENGVPPQVVKDLLMISNIFFQPSLSEGCSLTMIEAAITKNLLILNEDFPPSKEFGEDGVLYAKFDWQWFGKNKTINYHPNIGNYYNDWANIIIDHVENNPVLKTHRKYINQFNQDWIFKNQLEPLLT
jgi:hypothetical protein